MNTAPETELISVGEYLRTSYEPEVEYLDGVLKEKPVPTRLHSFVQAMIAHWFGMHMEEWKVFPMTEVRTRVQATRFRLPDVSVARRGGTITKTQDEPPLIAIEIVSNDDRYADLRERARDLNHMGAKNIWLIDPDIQEAFFWGGVGEGNWLPSNRLDFNVDGVRIHLDLDWLWEKVKEYLPQE